MTVGHQRGSAAIELVLITPVLLLLVMFALAAGRYSLTRERVTEAARDAAREASTWSTPAAAIASGTQRGLDSLNASRVSCQAPQVVIDTSRLRPAGDVTADVTCTVALSDVLGLRLGGSKTFRARSVAAVDSFRSGG
ncbi:MAG: pilus assembly protein [Actinomycetota bacterium]|nr:pilus assembly protein [Actinomycetota bacterium]